MTDVLVVLKETPAIDVSSFGPSRHQAPAWSLLNVEGEQAAVITQSDKPPVLADETIILLSWDALTIHRPDGGNVAAVIAGEEW
jgi:hypothetical protein